MVEPEPLQCEVEGDVGGEPTRPHQPETRSDRWSIIATIRRSDARSRRQSQHSLVDDQIEANAMYGETGNLLYEYQDYHDRPERWFEEGRMDGRKEAQIEAQAELISRMATQKFDSQTGDQLLSHLMEMTDPERMAEFGASIIECDDAEILLDRADRAVRDVWHPRERRHNREIHAFNHERAREGKAREKGRATGRFEGRDKGHVEVIRRAATRKFSPETVRQLVNHQGLIRDPEWAAELGEWIIECNDDEDLLKRANQRKWWGHPSEEHAMREGWADGRAEGWIDGWARGQADGQVSLLRWQASWKFDIETAERLTEWLVEITDLRDLHQVSKWLIKCESGEELLERMTVMFGIPVPETVTEWAEQWLDGGAEPWIEEGREKVRNDVMCRMAARKFGTETAELLAGRLADLSEWHVDHVGKGLIKSKSKGELLSWARILKEPSSEEGSPERG